jgi:hypothetical protein
VAEWSRKSRVVSTDPPDGPAGLTSEWLQAALRQAGYSGVSITEVDVKEVGTGQTGSSFRVHVTFAGHSDLPTSFVAKLPAQDPEVRRRVAYGYRAEVAFYEAVAATVQVPVPKCFFSAISDNGESFVLLLEDLYPAQQGDQIAGCTPEQARPSVVALAGLHAPRWSDPAWRQFFATAMPIADANASKALGDVARMAADMFLDRLGHRLDAATRHTLDAYPTRVPAFLLANPQRFSLLHGDYRLDNLLFDPTAGSVTVVDWQTLAVGLPARDLAYFVSTSLDPEVRRAHEHALVEAYHTALVSLGVEDYDATECFDDYRIGMLQGPLIATLGAAFSATTARGDEMMLVMLERSCAAIRDLETLDRIDKERA